MALDTHTQQSFLSFFIYYHLSNYLSSTTHNRPFLSIQTSHLTSLPTHPFRLHTDTFLTPLPPAPITIVCLIPYQSYPPLLSVPPSSSLPHPSGRHPTHFKSQHTRLSSCVAAVWVTTSHTTLTQPSNPTTFPCLVVLILTSHHDWYSQAKVKFVAAIFWDSS